MYVHVCIHILFGEKGYLKLESSILGGNVITIKLYTTSFETYKIGFVIKLNTRGSLWICFVWFEYLHTFWTIRMETFEIVTFENVEIFEYVYLNENIWNGKIWN